VLFVSTPTYIGGTEISLLSLMEGLTGHDYVPHLLTGGDGPFLKRAHEAGVPSSGLELAWFSRRRPWRYARSIWKIVRSIRNRRIALVHTNCDHSLRYVMLASRLAGVPYVSHVRDMVRTWFRADNVVALNRAARVIANSNAVAQACIQAGVEPGRTTTIHDGIDVEAFRAVPAQLGSGVRKELGIPDDAVVIGIVGQIQPLKGHAELVEASLQLVAKLDRVQFLVVGSPPPGEEAAAFAASLRSTARGLERAGRFHFAGFRSDTPAIMKAIDILAIPSWTEAFGIVAVEGMAAGCAVVATDVGGLPEIVTHELDGLLVPPRDVDALSTALYRLAVEPRLRGRLGQAAHCSAERFGAASHVRRVVDVYDRVLAT
jgi:glycosyltransferase involved in cell wall biosynthesis